MNARRSAGWTPGFARSLIATALGLWLAAGAAQAQTAESDEGPRIDLIRPALKPATAAQVRKAFAGLGVQPPGYPPFVLEADGTFVFPSESGCTCSKKGTWSATSVEVRGSCAAVCVGGYDAVNGGPANEVRETREFSFVIKGASGGLVVYESERGTRHCNGPGDCALLVEILPGASDKMLFERIKERFTAYRVRDWADYPMVFEGPQARIPRVESEVLFTEGNRQRANAIAEFLEPVIGPVGVKPWPGKWDYEVVVVAGSKVAGAAPAAK